MKSTTIRTLAIAAISLSYSHHQLMAEPAPTPTNPADHGTNVVPSNQKGTGKGTSPESGTTGKIDPNSAADHGNNNATSGKRIESKGDDTNPTIVTPNTPRRNDPEAPKPKGETNTTNGVSPTNPADHGNNSSPGVKPGTGTNGTGPAVNSSTGNPNAADHGNNAGKGTNTATEQRRK